MAARFSLTAVWVWCGEVARNGVEGLSLVTFEPVVCNEAEMLSTTAVGGTPRVWAWYLHILLIYKQDNTKEALKPQASESITSINSINFNSRRTHIYPELHTYWYRVRDRPRTIS